MDANRNLLFGLLGLQNGLIDAGMLVSAFQAWTRDRSKPLAEILVSAGSIDAEQRRVLEMMVDLHLKKHGGDMLQSLAVLSIDDRVRDQIAKPVIRRLKSLSCMSVSLKFDWAIIRRSRLQEPLPIAIAFDC